MYQFFVEENQVQNDRIVVIGEDVNHIVNVLRMKPGEKVSNIEITDQNIKAFDPIARKNGLDYNVKKIENGKPPTYLVSFRGKDIDVMTEAFREFTVTQLNRQKKPSIRKVLATFKEKAKELNNSRDKVKNKDRGREL